MNDILFGNNNTKIIRSLSKKYFKKNRIRNVTAILAITMTAFLFTSIISLAFNMTSSLQLSMFMQKGSKADGTLGYMTEEQFNDASPEVKRFFGNVRQVTELAKTNIDTVNTVTKGQFLKQYYILVQREKEQKLIPESMKQFTQKLAEKMSVKQIGE